MKELVEKIFPYFWPIAKKFRSLFNNIKKDILYIKWGLSFDEYVTLTIFVVILAFFSLFLGSIAVFYILFRYIDLYLVLLALSYSLIVSTALLLYFIYYPRLAKTDRIKEIEDNLPLFLVYFYGLVSSGVNLVKAIEISSKRKEFGALTDEIKFLNYLIKNLGFDLISAFITLAQLTPSQKFKEFLYELISVTRSGGNIRETVKDLAKESLIEYEIRLKSFIEKSNFLLTLYTFIFIAFPLVLLILAFLFSIASGNTKVISDLIPFFLGFIPMAYIMYLYIIYLIQPSL